MYDLPFQELTMRSETLPVYLQIRTQWQKCVGDEAPKQLAKIPLYRQFDIKEYI